MSTERIAIVTGAGSGIGRHCALALIKDGFHVALAGRRVDKLEETAALADNSALAIPVATDVTQPESVDNLFDTIKDKFGRVDVLFNNAGIALPATDVEDISFEKWNEVVAVNLTGMFLCIQAATRIMKRQDPMGGRIINNGSISAYMPRPKSIAYTATKHAVTGLTRSTSLDGREFNIACGQIDIGNADTNMVAAMKKGVLQANGSTAVEPTMDIQNVADAVVYMANLPLAANVQFMTVMASSMPYIGRG
ncbi:MAG: SDR family oxidoreductase [Planctomycetales bacterium]|nr:SDR family oxidoreductase [Planctomycetales bacterium]